MFELVERALSEQKTPQISIDDLNSKFESVGFDQLLIWGFLDYGSNMVLARQDTQVVE